MQAKISAILSHYTPMFIFLQAKTAHFYPRPAFFLERAFLALALEEFQPVAHFKAQFFLSF